MRRSRIASTAIRGALAGAVATWLMDKLTTLAYEQESEPVRKREDEARQGKTAYGVAAEKLARHVVRTPLSDEQRGRYGTAIHWALGIGTGALYGALRNRAPIVGFARGLAFGTGFWLLVDELANPLLGLTPGPRAFPWQTHARGLVGHLAYGAAVAAALDAVEPIG
jgi:hypothetical protein